MKARWGLLRDALLALVFHVAPRFANVVIFILVGRLVGPDQAGLFSLATTYLLILTTVMRGLDDMLIRQVAREPDRAADNLKGFLTLRFGLALVIYSVFAFALLPVMGYPTRTVQLISLLAFSVLPDSLTFVVQATLLGQRRFGPPALVFGGVSLFKLIFGGIALAQGYSLTTIGWIWVACSTGGLIVLLMISARYVPWLHQSRWFDPTLFRHHWRTMLAFMAITTLLALDSQTDTVLLSLFRTESDVGWYNAATTITATLIMLVQAYRFSVYPLMARYAHTAPERLNVLLQKSVHYMGVIAMPIVMGTVILAPQIIEFIFGARFAPSVPALRILAVALLLVFVSEPLNRFMLAKDRQRALVGLLVISVSMNVALNLFLTPRYGVIGSSLARAFSTTAFFGLNYGYIILNLTQAVRLRGLFRPVVASFALMIVVLIIMSSNVAVAILLGSMTYVATLWLVGGVLPDEAGLIKQWLSDRFLVVRSKA